MKKKNSKKNKNNKKIKWFISKDNYLYYIFFILLIIVVILGVMVYSKKDDTLDLGVDLIVPIMEDNDSRSLTLDLNALKDRGYYLIKVTNYNSKKVNDKKIKYSIWIDNDSKSSITVVKDDEKKNLMIDQDSTIIEDVYLDGGGKQYSIYKFSVSGNGLKKGDKLHVKIVS